MGIDRALLFYARQRAEQTKSAFVPSDAVAQTMDPSGMAAQQAMPPGMADVSAMMGTAPAGMGMPGGMPGTPPMGPAAVGGAAAPVPSAPMPPAAAGGGGDVTTAVQQAVQQAMQQPTAGGNASGGGGKPAKPSLDTVAMDVFQLKKMLFHLFNSEGRPLPPGLLDGPNRDPQTGQPLPPNTPGSTSDPGYQEAGQQQAAAQLQSAISPIEPMQGAFPQPKAASLGPTGAVGRAVEPTSEQLPSTTSRARAVAAIFQRRRAGKT